jgi:DNA-binding transcriptional LysR family regulator
MLDVRRMQVLRAVVTSGSITAAATNLGYTPSAISQQISVLEKEAGLPLLAKVGRGVQPTAAGKLLTDHAGTIADNLAEAERALADLREGRTGTLRVRYFYTAGAGLVPQAVAEFRKQHPSVQLDLANVEPLDPIHEAAAGRADVSIVVIAEDKMPPLPGIQLVHLLDDPYSAVLPDGHPLTDKRVLDLADLAGEAWVDNEHYAASSWTCRQILLDACASAGFSPSFSLQCNDYQTAQGFVAAGLGISLIPKLGLGSVVPGVVVRPVRRPEPIRHIYAAVPEFTADQPATASLIRCLRDAAAHHTQ